LLSLFEFRCIHISRSIRDRIDGDNVFIECDLHLRLSVLLSLFLKLERIGTKPRAKRHVEAEKVPLVSSTIVLFCRFSPDASITAYHRRVFLLRINKGTILILNSKRIRGEDHGSTKVFCCTHCLKYLFISHGIMRNRGCVPKGRKAQNEN
jgi:hypothetical protein